MMWCLLRAQSEAEAMRILGLDGMRAEMGRMADVSISHSLITRISFLIIEFIFQEPHKSSLVR